MSAYHTVTLWDFCFVTHCNKLQHTATHTARQSATHCNSHCKTYNLREPTSRSHPIPRDNTLNTKIAIHCTRSNTLYSRVAVSVHYTARHCNKLRIAATNTTPHHTATHYDPPHYTATHCTTPQHTAIHRNTLHRTAPCCIALRHTATYFDTLQHTATHSKTLQHTSEVRQPSRQHLDGTMARTYLSHSRQSFPPCVAVCCSVL